MSESAQQIEEGRSNQFFYVSLHLLLYLDKYSHSLIYQVDLILF
jgi:hypothetical protein